VRPDLVTVHLVSLGHVEDENAIRRVVTGEIRPVSVDGRRERSVERLGSPHLLTGGPVVRDHPVPERDRVVGGHSDGGRGVIGSGRPADVAVRERTGGQRRSGRALVNDEQAIGPDREVDESIGSGFPRYPTVRSDPFQYRLVLLVSWVIPRPVDAEKAIPDPEHPGGMLERLPRDGARFADPEESVFGHRGDRLAIVRDVPGIHRIRIGVQRGRPGQVPVGFIADRDTPRDRRPGDARGPCQERPSIHNCVRGTRRGG
jgi:hypothetical protein